MVSQLDLHYLSWKDFLAGWISGVCSISIGYPMETIKVRQQMNKEFTSISQHARFMFRKEGPRSFFQGMSYPLWTTGILNSLYFGCYANSLRMIENKKEMGSFKNCCNYGNVYPGWHWDCFYAGCIGGAVTTLINTPAELAKTILQAHSKEKIGLSTTPTSCLINLIKKQGITSCYHGGMILCIRDVPTFGIYAVCYEHSACMMMRHKDSNHKWRTFYEAIAGGISGVVTWFVAIPVDVIKSRYMSDCVNTPRHYNSTWDCIQKTYQKHGLPIFFRGMSVALLRAFPVNLVCFATYEQILKVL